MEKEKYIRLSRFLCRVLRHEPDLIGLNIEYDEGWVDVKELIEKSQANGKKLTIEILEEIVSTDSKKRYSFNYDNTKIKANYGHSIPINPNYEICSPIKNLYHGTATRFIDSILKSGINSKSRNLVHLSVDIDTAKSVGKRHGKPVVLEIDVKSMIDDGYKFYQAPNGVWLTDEVPVKYIINKMF